MDSILHSANEWLDAAARDLRVMHPDWTHDRPKRHPFVIIVSNLHFYCSIHMKSYHISSFIPAVQTREAGTFLQRGQ